VSFRDSWKQHTTFFHGARWAFWVLALIPIALIAASPCNPESRFFTWSYPLLLALCCLWEAHVRWLRSATASSGRLFQSVLGRASKSFVCVCFLAFLLAIPAALLLPTYQCYNDRSKVSEVILAMSSLRSSVTERVGVTKTLDKAGVGLQVAVQGRVAGGAVTESGTLIFVSADPPAVITMTPRIVNTSAREVQWTCVGYPEKIMPMICRPERSP
jgi:type IV pilus assembly protein PilA